MAGTETKEAKEEEKGKMSKDIPVMAGTETNKPGPMPCFMSKDIPVMAGTETVWSLVGFHERSKDIPVMAGTETIVALGHGDKCVERHSCHGGN